MPESLPEVILCPPERRGEALSLVLSEVVPSQRSEIAGALLDGVHTAPPQAEALYVVMRDGRVSGAAWGQRQPGNTALLWPPRAVTATDRRTARELVAAVIRHLDGIAVGMTQALLPSSDCELAPQLTSAGFAYLADLIYLTCEAERFPLRPPHSGELEFGDFHPAERERLTRLVERTYEGSLDCAALNGRRRMADVIDGYLATGTFRAENWRIVRHQATDVGVLLVAEHPRAGHWELMYMGLVPEARGRGWGRLIVEQAKWMARCAPVERIVLAVDAANRPALAMYERCGFAAWDRRSVFVRFFP